MQFISVVLWTHGLTVKCIILHIIFFFFFHLFFRSSLWKTVSVLFYSSYFLRSYIYCYSIFCVVFDVLGMKFRHNLYFYSAPERSIVMSMSVCVCPWTCLRNYTSDLHQFLLCLLFMAVARSSSGGIMICYIFPVLLMTSYLHISWGCSTLPLGWDSEVHMQPWAWHVGIPIAGIGHSGLVLDLCLK